MDIQQIIKYIDDGANFYIQLFGTAGHMQLLDNGYYSYIKPKEGQPGINFVFDIRLENLPIQTQREKIAEIKQLGMPIWLDLLASDQLHRWIYGKDKVHGQTVFNDTDEVYMAMLPVEKPDYPAAFGNMEIVKVNTPEEFTLWAKITNDIFCGGYPDMHPIYHYPLYQRGVMKCFILYKNNAPSAVAAIMDDNGVCSLEFAATVPEMRRQGLALAVCAKAVNDAFANGAKIITVRAINAAVNRLYQLLGFTVYNYAL